MGKQMSKKRRKPCPKCGNRLRITTGIHWCPRCRSPLGPLTIDAAIALLDRHAPGLMWDWDDPDGVHAAWRIAARATHPDTGGDPATFRRVTEARDLLVGEVTR